MCSLMSAFATENECFLFHMSRAMHQYWKQYVIQQETGKGYLKKRQFNDI